VYFALVYGAFQLINGKPVVALISGLFYAAAMTAVMLVKRKRDMRAAGDRSIADVALLEQSLGKKAALPTDFRDRVALQSLIARKRRQNRFGAIFGPIVFGCMTILGVVIGVTSGTWWFVPVFVAFGVLSIWAPMRVRRRLDEKESSLNAALSARSG
jgi:Flp pilus assembly protein TadB